MSDASDSDIDAHVKQMRNEIEEAQIRTPGPGEYVADCHFSRTGFGIWRRGACTCNPADAPAL